MAPDAQMLRLRKVPGKTGSLENTYSPYKQTTQAQLICKINFLLKSLFVVVRNPLILIPDEVLDGILLIILRLKLLLVDDLGDFLV